MDRRLQRDQQLEGTAKPTGNAKKAGPQPWELERYIYKEPSTDDGRPSHSDPRLELAQRIHSQHQDSAFIPSDDDDCGYGYPGFGSDFTPHLDASGSNPSELGTLAGGRYTDKMRLNEIIAEVGVDVIDEGEGRMTVRAYSPGQAYGLVDRLRDAGFQVNGP